MTEEVRSQRGRSLLCFSSEPTSLVSFSDFYNLLCCVLSFNFTWVPSAVDLIFCIPPLFLCCSLFHSHFLTPSLVVLLTPTSSPLSPPRLTQTTTDLTISPIQPPRSNYHGQNRVIKSNGLLYEVHTLKQNKSFSHLIYNCIFATYLLLPMIKCLLSHCWIVK